MNNISKSNRLASESSPYLLQHAQNPVDWWPWTEEAFAAARAENKPVFLSIGYSACHWCHVMERESFEDEEVAALLNNNFISIKVDREQRPDVDAVYMDVCQAMTGSGGWPLTILMTPGKQPFYAASYLPKNRKYGHAGLMELLAAAAEKWHGDPGALENAGRDITAAVAGAQNREHVAAEPGRDTVRRAEEAFEAAFDPDYGGFGNAPKFPMPHTLMFLMRYHALESDQNALDMVEMTIQGMYAGGIFDHLGYGFSRYSTDERWLIPHFEKMLYDNALMCMALIECYQATGNPLYRGIAERTLEYVAREMTSKDGGFFSAQDADVDGREGAYYTFTPDEVLSVLGGEDGDWFCAKYGITEGGNFEGKSVPNLFGAAGLSDGSDVRQGALDALYGYRAKRHELRVDDKLLTAWNALMIAAYARAYTVLGKEDYLKAALRALGCVRGKWWDSDGLKVGYRDGAMGDGFLSDYAFLAWAHLELHKATLDARYLSAAAGLAKDIIAMFTNPGGGYYMNPEDGEQLIFRPVETFDGALPSGNSVFAYCLVKLAALTGEAYWEDMAQKQLAFLAPRVEAQPRGGAFALMALMEAVYPSREVVCALKNEEDARAVAQAIGKRFIPNLSVLIKTANGAEEQAEASPFIENYPLPDGRFAFYVCQNRSCGAPVRSLEEMLAVL